MRGVREEHAKYSNIGIFAVAIFALWRIVPFPAKLAFRRVGFECIRQNFPATMNIQQSWIVSGKLGTTDFTCPKGG
jgi:hypothetical protein